MKGGTKFPASKLQIKPERKVIEKNRRNHMKFLYKNLYSLIPPNFISEGGGKVADRVDRTINYIQNLQNNLEICKKKKEKLLCDQKRSHQQTQINNMCSKSLDVKIHQISHDIDAVLVIGLNNYSSFSDVVRLLDRYSAGVTLANYSKNGHWTFHILQKQIEAQDVCKRLKMLFDGYSNMKELCDALFCNIEVDQDPCLWDVDFQSCL
ncbi:hypothetical protein R6Q57_012840 [Mikania cordata]